MGPEQHAQHDYADVTHEISTFHEQLLHARSSGNPDAELEAERKMNESLDELNDVMRALGRTASNGEKQ